MLSCDDIYTVLDRSRGQAQPPVVMMCSCTREFECCSSDNVTCTASYTTAYCCYLVQQQQVFVGERRQDSRNGGRHLGMSEMDADAIALAIKFIEPKDKDKSAKYSH